MHLCRLPTATAVLRLVLARPHRAPLWCVLLPPLNPPTHTDYGFEYSDEEPEEEDVDIENQYYNSKGQSWWGHQQQHSAWNTLGARCSSPPACFLFRRRRRLLSQLLALLLLLVGLPTCVQACWRGMARRRRWMVSSRCCRWRQRRASGAWIGADEEGGGR